MKKTLLPRTSATSAATTTAIAPWAANYEQLPSTIGFLRVGANGEPHFTPSSAPSSTMPSRPSTPPAVVATPPPTAAEQRAHASMALVVHPERDFKDLKSLTSEIFRLKAESNNNKHEPHVAQALKMRIVMLQSQWVGWRKRKASLSRPHDSM